MSVLAPTALASLIACRAAAVDAAPLQRQPLHVSLAPNGAIGTWLLSGPCESLSRISVSTRPGETNPCAGARWQTLANAAGDFDWAENLAIAPNEPVAAVVGFWLYLERSFDGWLLVSGDGKLRASVDGRWVYRREIPHQRGRGFVPIQLALDPGLHPIWIGAERFGNRSTLSALLRERATNEAPRDAQVYLPGTSVTERLVERLLASTVSIPLGEAPLELEVRLAFPAGLVTGPLPVRLTLQAETGAVIGRWSPGELTAENSSTPLVVHLAPLRELASDRALSLVIELGKARLVRRLWLSPTVVAGLERASRARNLPIVQASKEGPFDDLGATLEARWLEVTRQMTQPTNERLSVALQQLSEVVDALEQDRNPLRHTGLVDAYLRSTFDHHPVSTLLYVPQLGTDRTTPRPLVVLLHGYNGTPRRILDAFMNVADAKAMASIDGFVLAPAAHGNTFYRGPGERNVLEAIDWVVANYPIDRNRISITGVSMGGTGAAEIAFRHSELFAAAAPLCGYHSYFVRRDTANRPLRPWERRLMHRLSPASFAESGHDIPLFVAHGTKDFPLENSKSLTNRYAKLGYHLEQDWPNLGHSVWKKTYANGSMFHWLTKWHKDPDPNHVVLATSSRALGRKYWVELTNLEAIELPSLLDARVVTPTEVKVQTRGVLGFRISGSRHLLPDAEVAVTIDGTRLAVPNPTKFEFLKYEGQWTARMTNGDRSAMVEGPWSELFTSPIAVVFGSQNRRTASLNREIALRLIEPRPGVDLQIPVLSDAEFSPESSPLRRVIYVGRPDDHRHLAEIAARLPIRIGADAIELGTKRFTERDVGVAFVYPDPTQRDRLLGVVSGNGPEGLWRVLSLPALLPDFVVFDHGTEAAAGEPVLGTAAYLRAAGFFRSDWSLPDQLLDPLAPDLR